ncbi:MAG: FxDxF family PEP-CTERM protein [Acidobacteriota bacterium]
MSIKHLVGALAMAAACSAGATTVNWDSHGALELAAMTVDKGSFADYLNFTLDGNSALKATAVSTNLSPLLGIEDASISLYSHGATDTLINSYTFDGTTGSTSHMFYPTGPGSYFYKITGVATGTMGGFYSIASATAAVPEPRVWALALSALLTVGLISRRGSRR